MQVPVPVQAQVPVRVSVTLVRWSDHVPTILLDLVLVIAASPLVEAHVNALLVMGMEVVREREAGMDMGKQEGTMWVVVLCVVPIWEW